MKRARATDREILALRDQMVRNGWVDCVRIGRRIVVATSRYGPGHPRFRVAVRSGRGRPRPGEMGIVAALSGFTGCSRHIIHRALIGAPRCGWKPPAAAPPEATDAPHRVQDPTSGLAAVGLRVVTAPPRPERATNQVLVEAVTESLHAALSSQALPPAAVADAERLVRQLDGR